MEPGTFTYAGHNASFNGAFYPYSLAINGGKSVHIMPKQQKTHSILKVDFEQYEHLSSVFVETDAFYPTKIHFLIFNAASPLTRYRSKSEIKYHTKQVDDPLGRWDRANKDNTRTHTFDMEIEPKAIVEGPGYYPTLPEIYAMSITQMEKLRITQVLWTSSGDDRISRVAFRFSNGSLSPPLGFYKKNFKDCVDVPCGI